MSLGYHTSLETTRLLVKKIDSLLVISCDVDVDGFGVDGADGVDVPDGDAVAGDEHGTPFSMILIPLRP